MTEPVIPDDDDIAGVRYGDLRDLDTALTEARALVDEHREDLRALADAVGLDVTEPATDHQLVISHLLPAIRKLVATQALVDASAAELRARAGGLDIRGAGKTIDLGDGRKAQLVGRRLPPGMLGGRHTERRPRKHK